MWDSFSAEEIEYILSLEFLLVPWFQPSPRERRVGVGTYEGFCQQVGNDK